MDYKALFHIAIMLISSPARAWEEIRLQEDRRRVFMDFVYPMIGLGGLSVFLGCLFEKGWSEPEHFQMAMTRCCAVAVALFGGYYLAAYLINRMRVRLLGQEDDLCLSQQFAGYALVVPFLLQIIIGLLPDFMVIALLLQFYTIYVVWEGCAPMMQVPEKERLRFTVLTSLALLCCPLLIRWLFNKLTVML